MFLVIVASSHVFNLSMRGNFLFRNFLVRFPGNFVPARVFWKWLDGYVSSLAVECHYSAVFRVTFASVRIERNVIIGRISALNPAVLLGSKTR